jgi:2-polyprenyl-3-methyl-5-hydroxy-6-metoxy-1,4-benzoquinol methylase
MTQPLKGSVSDSLRRLFTSRFSTERISGVDPQVFHQTLSRLIGSIDRSKEGFLDASKQRDLSIKYHWGHNHDFGGGVVYEGRMGDRHIEVLAHFIAEFGLPVDLTGKRVLDIGVWTGGTSLLLAAMGADVIALEEVTKYAETVAYLTQAFSLEKKITCVPRSLFEALPLFADEFDYIIYSGVIYHVTDPLLSLRLIFSALKNGGSCFIETFGLHSQESVCRYEGPGIVHSGRIEDLNRGGWNYFIPSPACLAAWCRDIGFQDTKVGPVGPDSRLFAFARRTGFQDFCRAGISKVTCR